ncbi:MAG: aspartate kinase, partial [Kiritimatiellaeota bacterium]|nr:aspartate kinase [Kiritimatiellota bacterium]
MKVCKFGGSSVADAEQIRKVISIVKSDPARRVVVVSAPGKRHKDDVKVTDMLIAAAERILAGENVETAAAALCKRFDELGSGLGLDAGYAGRINLELIRRLQPVKTINLS